MLTLPFAEWGAPGENRPGWQMTEYSLSPRCHLHAALKLSMSEQNSGRRRKSCERQPFVTFTRASSVLSCDRKPRPASRPLWEPRGSRRTQTRPGSAERSGGSHVELHRGFLRLLSDPKQQSPGGHPVPGSEQQGGGQAARHMLSVYGDLVSSCPPGCNALRAREGGPSCTSGFSQSSSQAWMGQVLREIPLFPSL